jgi:hypothetical protein
MKTQLKKIVSSNILLYYLWFILVRKRKGLDIDFFRRDTDVFIDGYARSGNTFIIHLVRSLLPELNSVHHLHAVAPIKIALLLNLPAFILIRDPMNCISSKYLKHFAMRGIEVNTPIDEHLLNQFISDYLTYYRFVKKNQDRLIILNFDQLIESPKIIVGKIKDRLEIEKKISAEDLSQAIHSYRGATDTMGSSRPNQKKEKYKSLAKEHILQSDKYSGILKLYNSIINQP